MNLVGNDIVDFNENPTNKSCDHRFVKRVFSANEQKLIEIATNPDLMLWLLWAAKEAAYKIVSKLKLPPVFSHKKFQVSVISIKEGFANLNVQFENTIIPVQATWDCAHLQALGVYSTKGNADNMNVNSGLSKIDCSQMKVWKDSEILCKHFTLKEREAITHPLSAIVRYNLKEAIADTLRVNKTELQIIRPRLNNKMHPPFLLIKGKRSHVDISLTHHGRWIGWCFAKN